MANKLWFEVQSCSIPKLLVKNGKSKKVVLEQGVDELKLLDKRNGNLLLTLQSPKFHFRNGELEVRGARHTGNPGEVRFIDCVQITLGLGQ